ncbi:hypothetical protein Tco_1285230 [Tanacetum coccineum]
MVEEPMKMKKKDQISFDEQEAKRLQAEFDEEERLAREKDEANVALTEQWDDIQAKIKELMEIVPDEEEVAINAIPLATKPPTIYKVNVAEGVNAANEEVSIAELKMDDPDITMEEYVQPETERALKNAKVYNWDTTMYGKISSQHVNEVNWKIETSLSESDDEKYEIIYDNGLFSYKIFHVNDLKFGKDNDDDKIDIKQSLGDISIELLRDGISIDIVIVKQRVKVNQKACILELNKEIMKSTVLTTYTPYPSRKIQHIHLAYLGFRKKYRLNQGMLLDFQNMSDRKQTFNEGEDERSLDMSEDEIREDGFESDENDKNKHFMLENNQNGIESENVFEDDCEDD